MARLLDAVTPLADLLARTPAPDLAIASIQVACAEGPAAVQRVVREATDAAGIDPRLANLAMAHAGLIETDDNPASVMRLAAVSGALEILVEARREADVSLVFTVPAFLAGAFDSFTSMNPGVRAERTAAVVSEVAADARSSLIIAAPYLATITVDALIPSVCRVLDADGMVTVITRALSPRSPEPSKPNMTVVESLRNAATRPASGFLVGGRSPRRALEGSRRRRRARLPWFREFHRLGSTRAR